ncbi:hypothetical protein CFOL_v3_35603 [Cephalotus follicularis]|uniref:Retrovirus-related Pol polyprotein from transposon TNT 1-94-like beta-barrel domain-containing protein n=1 Tax=Cephalotus follicularis TaxID=3775 RepID=A0A1Q3DIG4_CEPFO|nr:hypothetical protein CFOL_v3_35603 [Cephalotus follicularis]
MGHIAANCWFKTNQADFVEEDLAYENKEESKLFMAYFDSTDDKSSVWFVDSGCSNHMSGTRSVFKELDETQKRQIRLGDNKSIQVEGRAPHTPKQNGVAERKNRTVVEMARSLLKARSLPNQLWAKDVTNDMYLLTISPIKAVWNQTPYEAWIGKKPRIHLTQTHHCPLPVVQVVPDQPLHKNLLIQEDLDHWRKYMNLAHLLSLHLILQLLKKLQEMRNGEVQ